MAKIVERTPKQIEADRILCAKSRERLIQTGVIRYRPGMAAEMVGAPNLFAPKCEQGRTMVVNPFTAGKFDPVKAAEKAPRTEPGHKTNVGAGTKKGSGGSKPGKGTSNPHLAEKRARKTAQVKRRGKKRSR